MQECSGLELIMYWKSFDGRTSRPDLLEELTALSRICQPDSGVGKGTEEEADVAPTGIPRNRCLYETVMKATSVCMFVMKRTLMQERVCYRPTHLFFDSNIELNSSMPE